MLQEQKRRSKSLSKKKGKHASKSTAATTSTSDAKILEIINKLKEAQSDSPEILDALKNPQLLALVSLAAQNQTEQTQGTSSSTRAQSKAKKSATPSLDDVIDDDDHYPKIGPGYSDEVSCISEISTPTVMSSQKVLDEEHYREVKGGPGALPPLLAVGKEGTSSGGSRPTRRSTSGRAGLGAPGPPGKPKNILAQVRPIPVRRSISAKTGAGGAAAQRRLNYQMAMSKLESSGFGKPPAATVLESPESSTNSNQSDRKSVV